MTNTETVSTERLAFLRLWAEQSEDEITLKASEVRELLASRHPQPVNEPGGLPEDLRATFPPSLPANWPEVLESRAKAAYLGDSKGTVDLLRAAAVYLRAASIPAPERSKEETGVKVKPLEWEKGTYWAQARCKAVGLVQVTQVDNAWDWRIGDTVCKAQCDTMDEAITEVEDERKARILSALETPEAAKHSDACGCGYCT